METRSFSRIYQRARLFKKFAIFFMKIEHSIKIHKRQPVRSSGRSPSDILIKILYAFDISPARVTHSAYRIFGIWQKSNIFQPPVISSV
jgi:hypothetical protein